MRRRPVDLILSDTGPLITLAVADRLDLLTTFERPVLIPDVVKEEALAKPGSLGHERLATWLGQAGHNQYKTIHTPFLALYHDLKTKPRRTDGTPATKGMGESTLMWVIANIETLYSPQIACLVLTEDGRAGDAMPENVHVLSTRSWLKGLENLKVIPSAAKLFDEVEAKGRKTSPYSRDRRGVDETGAQTEWTRSVIVQEAASASSSGDALPSSSAQFIHKIFVTKDELATAISLWGDRTKNGNGNPITNLLLEAGTAVAFDTHSKGGKASQGDVLYGIRALTALERGFGKAKYRSLIIDESQAEDDTTQRRPKVLGEAVKRAIDATRDRFRAEGRHGVRPLNPGKKSSGLGD